MIRIFLIILASILFIIGLITLPTPAPIGLILLAVSTAIFITVSQTFRNWVKALRRRYPNINSKLKIAEGYLPEVFRKALRETIPDDKQKQSR